MGTTAAVGEVTVTPVYWAPNGYPLSPSYQSIINGFLSNVAADSGRPTNVFASLAQYTNASGVHLSDSMHAGAPITDTDAYPSSPAGCSPDAGAVYADTSGYRACVTDVQLQTEVVAFLAARALPSDTGHLYVVLLPKGVESCFTSADGQAGGECSLNSSTGKFNASTNATASSFCGYHSVVGGNSSA
ncbi:MAG: hypothetical protein M3137_08840, partial [Actinomycetota bacterium]|nr:hypothetical protein [Actinomycetota bacterium]